MRFLTLVIPACAALAGLVALVPASAQAASSGAASVVSAQDTNVQTVAQGCGPRHHRVWRRGRSWCVHN